VLGRGKHNLSTLTVHHHLLIVLEFLQEMLYAEDGRYLQRPGDNGNMRGSPTHLGRQPPDPSGIEEHYLRRWNLMCQHHRIAGRIDYRNRGQGKKIAQNTIGNILDIDQAFLKQPILRIKERPGNLCYRFAERILRTVGLTDIALAGLKQRGIGKDLYLHLKKIRELRTKRFVNTSLEFFKFFSG